MNNRQKILDHHPIKAEIGINILQEVVGLIEDSVPNMKHGFVNILKNTLLQAGEIAVQKYNEKQKEMESEVKK